MNARTILMTGATGYIGGRLTPCLLERGYTVRCLTRDPARLHGRQWVDDVEVIKGNALTYDTLMAAMQGVDVAYYMIHSLASGKKAFEEHDRRAADNFGRAAAAVGIRRIIYLGGLLPSGNRCSLHLHSRMETGNCLRTYGVPVTEFRAGVIVGSGSLSFELIRYVTERIPFMICPQWAQTPAQPIALRTVLQYLIEALDVPESTGRIIEIGGNDVLSYGDMFRIYAKVRGLKRWVVGIPILSPRLGPVWTSLITPFPLKIVRPLIEGLNEELVVRDDTARRLFSVRPIAYEAAVRLALRRFARGNIDTIWSDALSSSVPNGKLLVTLGHREGLIRERVGIVARASPAAAFQVIQSLGGDTGWLYARLLWQIRGFIDWLVGGVGLRRGRRSPTDVRVGDALDFWRVEALEQDRLLRMRAEMKVPGKAWLQLDVKPVDVRRVRIRLTAFFEPKGLWGLIYWYSLYPIHHVIFKGMVKVLRRRAESVEIEGTVARAATSDADQQSPVVSWP